MRFSDSGTGVKGSDMRAEGEGLGSFRKLGVPYLGVPTIRILLFRVRN